ncbi:ABC transporter permease [Frankia sp. CNm7]|uniref:ABC transporter permease n=1 Tax=Frankia nepalensis TaxID=1836974 RepID=A0A937RBL1_9ACTN|nr:ABC transporter permease [Frankia nepalensis]MBL7495529.1 ABC transporter permease [Frankia nepalensis]MBL7509810.1 ABC transporter permease [Frankia nepalensis]MBL7517525.1 ABC transporter permease [Frankia nepalensis]MBL7626802.1 ABC transporter permease [Frankia nepalensis]
MVSVELAIAGLAIGAVAALSGIGLLVTYRTNGVLNLAHGGIATLVAYVYREMTVEWGFPVWLSAVIAMAFLAPGLGLLLERLVFRPLARRRASAAETLVASLGVLVLSLGMCAGIWGLGTRNDTPSIFPDERVGSGSWSIEVDTLSTLALILVACVFLGVVQNRTRFGRQVRAVVDDRELAEMSSIPADRVAAVGWAFGTTLAGFTGVLLAPRFGLSPYGLSLVVLTTFAVIVAARLSSLPVAVLTGLAIGIAQSELTQFSVTGVFADTYRTLTSSLFVVVLLVLLLLSPKLRELGGDAGSAGRLSSREAPERGTLGERHKNLIIIFAGIVMLMAPLFFGAADLRKAFLVPALALIFLSLVIVTGYSGQVSLGVAGYAGLGALFSLKLEAGEFPGLPEMPGLLAILIGALLVAPIGLITGYPAIRRRGLALALTTFAVGATVTVFVFNQPDLSVGVYAEPLYLGGWMLNDKAFYIVEMVGLGLGLLAVYNLHRGRLGRALVAVRDHTEGAAAVGVDVRNLKLLAFTVSSVVAGLGGALLSHSTGSFSSTQFEPMQSLLWFTAVVVFGADSAVGAIIAAAFIVSINVFFPEGSSTLAVGILALSLGWLPGGLASAVRGLVRFVALRLADEFVEPEGTAPRPRIPSQAGVLTPAAQPTTGRSPAAVAPGGGVTVDLTAVDRVAAARGLTLTPFGRSLLGRLGGGAPAAALPVAASLPGPNGASPVTAGTGTLNHPEGGRP